MFFIYLQLHAPNEFSSQFTDKKSLLFIWELIFFSKSCSFFQVFWTKNFAWGSRVSQNHDWKIAKLWTLRGKANRARILMKKRISDFFYENRQNLYGFGQNELFGRILHFWTSLIWGHKTHILKNVKPLLSNKCLSKLNS